MFDQLLRYVTDKLTAVLAWSSPEGLPQAATIFYWIGDVTETEFNIYFITRSHTRKAIAVDVRPGVAVVIGTEFEPKSVQFEGRAELVRKELNAEGLKKTLRRMDVPPTQSLLYENSFFQGKSRGNDFAVYRVRPTMIRFMDYNRSAHDVVYHTIVGENPASPTTAGGARKRVKAARRKTARRKK